jgi:glycosyltransferase involved in cell wall biosynthesis
MSNGALVSIITPSYNQGKFIEDAILSVKNQDYPNVEHIIVDGGSTDNTLKILKKYEGTYNLRWISEPDEGQSDAINKGVRMSNGEIIGWLNSDDVYFDKHVVSRIVEEFYRHQDVDLIHGDSLIIGEDNSIIQVVGHLSHIEYDQILVSNQISAPATFIRKKEDIILDKNLHYAMDYELWVRLMKNNMKFKHVDDIVACPRNHPSAKTTAQRDKLYAEMKKVQKRYGQSFGLKYHLLNFMDKVHKGYLRVKGIQKLLSIYINRNHYNFAFEPKFDSLPKALIRQVLYPELTRL